MKWSVLLLLAVLPLQWYVVVSGVRLHLVAMALFLLATLVALRVRASSPVLSLTWVFVVANGALCLVWSAANVYHGLGIRQPAQQLVYLAVFVAVGTVAYNGLTRDGSGWVRVTRWSGPLTLGVLLLALSVSMALNNVNAASVFSQTIAAADPEILQKELFRAAFTGFGFEEGNVSGNFRHEVFGAVLIAMATSAACVGVRPFASARTRRLYLVFMALATTIILLSTSRSVIIALAVWPLLVLLRSALALRVTPRVVGGVLVVAFAASVMTATGVLTVLWVRFTQDTGSYEARDGLLERAFVNIGDNVIMGGVDTVSASSHNFVLDSWLRAGVFAAVAAAVVTILLLGLFLTIAVTIHREATWMLPVAVLIALPLVRLFTAGGGLITPVSWVGLGLAAGFLAYRRVVAGQAGDRDGSRGWDPERTVRTQASGAIERSAAKTDAVSSEPGEVRA